MFKVGRGKNANKNKDNKEEILEMVCVGTVLKVMDNSGARKVRCIGLLGVKKRRWCKVGEVIVVSVRVVNPIKKMRKGEVHRAVIVGTRKAVRRGTGDWVRFDENVVVLVNKKNIPLGTRVLGPVMQELRGKKFSKVMSLAKGTV
jgi:large subunit ribosomal protein L14